MASFLDCFFVKGGGYHRNLLRVSYCNSVVTDITTKEAFLPFTVNSSNDHGLSHGSTDSTDCGCPHGLRYLHRSQTSSWSLVIQTRETIMAIDTAQPMDVNMASGSSTDKGHPLVVTWTTDINIGSSRSLEQRLQSKHRPGTPSRP